MRTEGEFGRSPRIWWYFPILKMGMVLLKMSRLILLPTKSGLPYRAKKLAQLGQHIAELRKIYEEDSMSLAKEMIGHANLSPEVEAVEVVETDEGFAIEFKFK